VALSHVDDVGGVADTHNFALWEVRGEAQRDGAGVAADVRRCGRRGWLRPSFLLVASIYNSWLW